jgi:diguanylate cyclase (GGDEF)-like protein
MDLDNTPVIENLHKDVKALEGRDLQLWSIGVLTILVVAAGIIAIVLPNIAWNMGSLRLNGRYLPPLLFGFIALIVLFNIYAIQQRQSLSTLRQELLRQFVRSDAAEKLSLVDPLTDIFNRRYLDRMIASEVKRADRQQTMLTFLMIDVNDFKSANTRLGHGVGDRILSEMGKLLKKTFRTSDITIRYGGDEFLVVMPETDERQAQRAVERLLANVDSWNREYVQSGFRLTLSCGIAAYTKDADVKHVIETAYQRMILYKAAPSVAR